MADTATYAAVMKHDYPKPRATAAQKQAARRRAKAKQKRAYLSR